MSSLSASKLRSGFIPAQKNHLYLSYNGSPLTIGETVYQITFIEGTSIPLLIKFTVEDRVNDGRVKITGSTQNGNFTNTITTVVAPNTLHTNPKVLLETWWVNTKHQLEIELPAKIQGLEKLLKELDINWNPEKIEVGTGLTEMEI